MALQEVHIPDLPLWAGGLALPRTGRGARVTRRRRPTPTALAPWIDRLMLPTEALQALEVPWQETAVVAKLETDAALLRPDGAAVHRVDPAIGGALEVHPVAIDNGSGAGRKADCS